MEDLEIFNSESFFKSPSSILVKGDNLDFLSSVEKFEPFVDFIYIDPPYNTGNNFTYKDRFYEGKDRHSAWLDFIKIRLEKARSILKDEGVIFIAIGQDELYRLKVLCDDIFGEDNFINNFMWLCGKGKKDEFSRTLQQDTLCYAKNRRKCRPFVEIQERNYKTQNPDNDPRGQWFSGSISFSEKRSSKNHKNFFAVESPSGIKWERQWLCSKEEMETLLAENKIYFGPAPDYANVPRQKIFNGEENQIIPKNIIDHCPTTRDAQNYLDKLLGEKGLFDNPKPVELIEHFLKISNTPKNAVIMDFFAGSGTTFEAVSRLNESDGGNRKCILVQKDEGNIFEICKKRVQKVIENEPLNTQSKDPYCRFCYIPCSQ
ncbi:MAG: site-specific DNA-methyltransferase [Treponema sp.]|nr:site-specific DNA-methyltransferase [Treponema sp.]